MLKNYGRSLKLLLAEKDIPNLHFDVTETKEKGKPSEKADVMEIMNVDTKENVQNSDSREHSRNSLKSVAGGRLHPSNQHGNVEKITDAKLLKETSEYRELSQESRSSEHLEETSRKMVKQTISRDTQPEHSKSREHSQNSREEQAVKKIGYVNVTVSVRENQCSVGDSDFPKHSQNSLSKGEHEMDKGGKHVL